MSLDTRKPRRKSKKTNLRPSRRPWRRSGKRLTITPAEARRRAGRHVLRRIFEGATVRDGAAARLNIYTRGSWKGKDVWVVYKNPDNPLELKSSSIVVVGKRTGRVLYDGLAGDEG